MFKNVLLADTFKSGSKNYYLKTIDHPTHLCCTWVLSIPNRKCNFLEQYTLHEHTHSDKLLNSRHVINMQNESIKTR